MSVDISFFTDPTPAEPEPRGGRARPMITNDELTEPLPGLPRASNQRVITEKDLKRVAKEMALGMKVLDQMNRPAPMTATERREQRRLQQIERRNAKALAEVVL